MKFTREPPDELQCNPFDLLIDQSIWILQIECKIEVLDQNSYQINWYHRRLNETTDIVSNLVSSKRNNIKSVFGKQWINTTFNDSMLGEYWCQVMNASNSKMCGTSNVVEVHAPECYNTIYKCSGVQYINSSKCAADSLNNVTNIPSIRSLVPSSTIPNNDISSAITEVLNSSKTNPTLQTITHIISEITINSTSLSTSYSQDDQEIDSGLTNAQTVIIISALIIIFGILMITSCLVMSCLYLTKRKKYNFKGDNCGELKTYIFTYHCLFLYIDT